MKEQHFPTLSSFLGMSVILHTWLYPPLWGVEVTMEMCLRTHANPLGHQHPEQLPTGEKVAPKEEDWLLSILFPSPDMRLAG